MKKETLAEILTIGIFTVLFIPLIGINNLYFPFITGKAFTFRILIEILGGVWLLLAISDKKYRPRFSWLLIAILSFISVISIADIFGINPYRSFWSDFERMDGLINLLHLILYFLIAGSALTTKKVWDYFFNTTIGISVLLSLLALLQLAGMMEINTDAGRLDSTIGNAAHFGIYVLLHIFLAIFMLIKNQSFIQQSPILNRFAVVSLEGMRNQPRYYFWSIAVEGFKERPILGWGQENYKNVFFKYYHPALYNSEIISDKPHNVVLEWLVSGGLLGVLSYLLIYGTVLYYVWLSKRSTWSLVEKSVLTGFLAGYFINGLFLFDNLTSYIIFFAFLAYVYSQTLPEYQEEKIHDKLRKRNKQEQQNQIKRFAIPVALVVLLCVYFVNAKGMVAASNMSPAIFFYSSDPETSLSQFKKALEANSFSHERIRQEIAVIATNMKDDPNIDSKIKQDYFNLARSEMEKQVQEMPPDAHNFYLLGSLLYSYGEYDEVLSFLERARELSPKKQVIILKLADVYIAEKNYKKAYEITQKVYELEPRYDLTRNMYAVSAILLGDNKTASNLLIERYGTDTLFDLKILQAYADTKQYGKIITTYEKRILENPNDTQTRFSLSVAYFEIGQWQMAIKTLEKTITHDPSVKDTAEFLISEIRAGRMPQ